MDVTQKVGETITVPAGMQATAFATCDPGLKAVSGGFQSASPSGAGPYPTTFEIGPNNDWFVTFYNPTAVDAQAFAIVCCSP
ncbi:hypothetical protein [Streptomyces sp. NBC_01264]|uniref:hypothetical protein n=1 Tax=Streptomyces sp. NBC_01264 TaxID=2903804 RepID=UPI0022522117|nr:hypothetical protein [Streptomyces sp. NBC_01264]